MREIFLNPDFPAFVIALFANLALAAVVFLYAERNWARRFFIGFVTAQILWITANYFSFVTPSNWFLFVIRTTFLFASIHVFFFYLFVAHFLDKTNKLRGKAFIASVAALIVQFVTVYSGHFIRGTQMNQEGIWVPIQGSAFPFFGIFVFGFIAVGFITIIRKLRKSVGVEKTQWRYLATGLSITFLFVLALSFLSFVITGKPEAVKFGHLYTLPFIVFTTYAMVKHHMLNLKAILAEICVILLNLLLLARVLTSQDVQQLTLNSFILVGALIVGVLLVKGVYREIHQREQLQVLTKELEAANLQLKELDKARAEFISIASHQLRTPPATIKWYLGAIETGDFGVLNPELKEAIQKTAVTNNAQISLIDDLLNASRIERGKMEFMFEMGDLVQLAQITYDQLVPQAKIKKVALEFHKPTEIMPLVVMDKEKLRQVINNLIDNAIKYTHKGTVTLEVLKDGESIRVQVSDTGKGIPKEQALYLFEKYNRGKDSVMHATGLGLGLYVARVVVEKHNGKIWAESEGEGKGSKFIFTIPIHGSIQPSSTATLDLTSSQGEHR